MPSRGSGIDWIHQANANGNRYCARGQPKRHAFRYAVGRQATIAGASARISRQVSRAHGGTTTAQKMERERIVQLFFFGFLAVMAYELYELMLPFLTPLAWGILLAFMAHPALIEVEKLVKRRSLSTAIISVAVGLGVIVPAIWLSGRLVVEAQALYAQAAESVNGGGVTKLHDWAVRTDLGAWVARKMGERGYKLDVTWLKDESFEDSEELPEPQDLAGKAITELEAVVDDLKEIVDLIEKEEDTE